MASGQQQRLLPVPVDSRVELELHVKSVAVREFLVAAAQPVHWSVEVRNKKTIDLSVHNVINGVHRPGDGNPVIETERCAANTGVFFPQAAGTLVFVFSNSFSLMTNKDVRGPAGRIA